MHSSASDGDEEGHIAAINVIPLVDVILVVLIIFMVTSVFTKDSALKLDLPTGSRPQQNSQPPAEITVAVDKNKNITVNNQATTVDELAAKIQRLQNPAGKTVVILAGDKDCMYGTIMPILDEISHTDTTLTLALQAPKAPAP